MTEVIFASISELDKQPSMLVKVAEIAKNRIVITKGGKPIGLMRKVTAKDRGRTETVTKVLNHANELLSSLEHRRGQIIITRNNQPIVVLKRISSKAFSIKE
jgi:PHD/YefM family antitoxin component YafN of YafNO toxin-antitoxin module